MEDDDDRKNKEKKNPLQGKWRWGKKEEEHITHQKLEEDDNRGEWLFYIITSKNYLVPIIGFGVNESEC
jgi:hypothetical protein